MMVWSRRSEFSMWLRINNKLTTKQIKMESKQPVRRTSSTSSAFLTSTISSPNVDSIIDAVATILHSQMLEVRAPP